MKYLIIIAVLPLIFFGIYAYRSMKFEQGKTRHMKERVAVAPDSIEICELHDNDPITISVKFSGEPMQRIPASGLSGVEAVQYFESLKKLAPKAQFVVLCNGHPSSETGE